MCSHNIQGGAKRKLCFTDVLASISRYDVLFLQETWLVDSNHFNVRGYGMFRSDRGSHKKRYTGSGGVITLYKTCLSKGLQKINSKHKDFMWVKFDKHFFNIKHDLYIVNCYIAPEDSVVHKDLNYDVFDVLSEEMTKYSKLGVVGVVGDLNARTGNIQEKLQANFDDFNYDREIDINDDEMNFQLEKRCNSDKVINQFGKKLLEALETHNLVIANGRTLGDTNGEKTC